MKPLMSQLLILLMLIPSLSHANQVQLWQSQTRQSNTQPTQYTSHTSVEHHTTPDNLYQLEQAAQQGDTSAMEQLADHYLADTHQPMHTAQALRWLIKLANLGNTQAAMTIGEMYQRDVPFPEALTMAELWLYSVADRDPEAERHYSLILQKKFNRQRAKQIANINALEQANVDSGLQTLPTPDISQRSPANSSKTYPLIIGLLLIIIAATLSWSFLLKPDLRLSSTLPSNQIEQLHQQLRGQAQMIQQQKQQLNKLYRELSRRQQKDGEQQWKLACALFGFNPDKLPNERMIKARYKQLSKIYHPDSQGSNAEMQRLNESLKLILQKTNK